MPGSGMGGGGSGGKPWPASSIKLCGPAMGPSGPIGPMPANNCISAMRKRRRDVGIRNRFRARRNGVIIKGIGYRSPMGGMAVAGTPGKL